MHKEQMLEKEDAALVRELGPKLGFDTEDEFVRAAVKEKLLELRKMLFFSISHEVRMGLEKKGITQKAVLEDFERARHENHNCGWMPTR